MGYGYDASKVDKANWRRWAGHLGTFGVSVVVADGFKCLTGSERGMVRKSNKDGLKRCIAQGDLFSVYGSDGKKLPKDDPKRKKGIENFVNDMEGLMVDSGHPTPEPPFSEENFRE